MRHVILLCGGRSAEHEVSLLSVASVIRNLDRSKYRVSVLGIARDGSTKPASRLRAELGELGGAGTEIPDARHWIEFLLDRKGPDLVVFPVLHGPYGEDGTVQGALELLDIPYVGASVGGSAVGMNKVYCKGILQSAGLPTLPALTWNIDQWRGGRSDVVEQSASRFPFPVFVKPVNLGSSVGISRCASAADLEAAIEEAFLYDDWILVEQGINAREIETSVLGGLEARVSLPGEIVPADVFYSYEAKYLNDDSKLLVPAPLAADQVREVQDLALRTFRALQLEGMARIDFLMDRDTDQFWVNEPNTIPGFTRISMYPKLWEASGLSYSDLLSTL
ncbi:MAG: D-alanine--D-alanine ligase family protein, partial [Acidobacteriota bacterium]